jgi:non-specific serine/threonine protein kinase/serine/threonine-protein kinase
VASGGGVAAADLAGDLDTIILKCLRKEPERRYASAQELSEDLRRYLEGLPVKARPDTLGYRVSKFARRHRFGIVAAGLLLASLVGGIATTLRQARIAETNRERAERRFNDVRRLAGSLIFDIHDEIQSLPGSTRARQHLVGRAREYLDSLAREAQGDAELQRELAAAYERLGDVQGGGLQSNLGDTKAALASYARAVEIREALHRSQRPNRRDALASARLQTQLATTLMAVGDMVTAERRLQDAVATLETLPGGVGDDGRLPLASAYQKMANAQAQLRRNSDAAASARKAVAYGEEHVRAHPEDATARLTLAAAYYEDGRALADASWESGLPRLRQARELTDALIREDPLNTRPRRLLLFVLNAEGLTLRSLSRRDEALAVYRRIVREAEEMARLDPEDRYAQAAVATANDSLGRALVLSGHAPDAVPVLRSGLGIALRLIVEDPGNGYVRNECAALQFNLARALLLTGQRDEGCRLLESAGDAWAKMREEGMPGESAVGLRGVEAERRRCR